MAVTVTFDQRVPQKAQGEGFGILTGTIQFDSSYPTNGEDVTAITKYFKKCHTVLTDSLGGVSTGFDRTNKKLLAYWVDTTTDGALLVEVADTTDLSAVTVSFVATGRF